MRITWYGHAAFGLDGGARVVIDPFFPPQVNVRLDDLRGTQIILVTHDHADHVGCAVELAKTSGAMVGCIVGTAQALVARGLPESRILNGKGFNMGGTVIHAGVEITMTQAFHSSESGAPAGYIIRMPDGPIVYHAGDTCLFSSMALWGELYPIDLALLPTGGVFTMDARQAAHACKLLGCRHVIPMHWGTFPVLAQSTDAFKSALATVCPACRCIDMQPGEVRDFQP